MQCVATYRTEPDSNGIESLTLSDWVGAESEAKPERAIEGSRLITYDETARKVRLYLANAQHNWMLLREKEMPV